MKRLASAVLLLLPLLSSGQARVAQAIQDYATGADGIVGVYATVLETGGTVSYQADRRFPMQSVYKFPIAMAVLDQVDRSELALGQTVHVSPADYIPQPGYSPIRDQFPKGVDLTVRELLQYSIRSDGSASDVLLKTLGGIRVAHDYVHRLGVTDMAIAVPEKIQVANDTIQYQNWSTPRAMTQLLGIFYTEDVLSDASRSLLLRDMIDSKTGTHRLKGRLPEGTVVAHKTGTSATYDGLTRATNDVGIITLPNGNHLAISIFIADSRADAKERDRMIATIAKLVYDHYRN